MRVLLSLLTKIERFAVTAKLRLNFPANSFNRCKHCGGPTAMRRRS